MPLLEPEEYHTLLIAAVETGCFRAMLTGGEPLLLPIEKLAAIVTALTSVPNLKDFWITTNGSLLIPTFCKQLTVAGLRKVTISIAAADNQHYHLYSKQERWWLDDILRHIDTAIAMGLYVKVDVPLSADGIRNYSELIKLIDILEEHGVREIAYFPLHLTWENRQVFKELFVEVEPITISFEQSQRWQQQLNPGSQIRYSDGKINVIIPAKPVPLKPSCQCLKCGHWCQGIYAAYVIFNGQRLYVRACHRTFGKGRNEFDIARDKITDKAYLVKLFHSVWNFAYLSDSIN
jgi:molybdenum cofactor biosynthesis enzyme MoaA